MPFESGTVSFRMYQLPRPIPEDSVELFAAHAAPPIDTIGSEQMAGWVTGRHLLDRNITDETAMFGGYLRLALQIAERKIPASMLHAECKMEELAILAAEDKQFLNRQQRSEIKRQKKEELLPNMPVQIKGLPFVHQPGASRLYAQALSLKQSDLFVVRFQQTLGFSALPLVPETAAMERKQEDVNDWQPFSFSPKLPDQTMLNEPGRDFLTWLWYVMEARNGTLNLPDIGDVQIMIDGPLTFVHEGNGAHETVLKNGNPVGSAEAKTCLLSGKKLRQAKLMVAQGDLSWQATVDADEFTFRSLSLPKSETLMDAVSQFQERMELIERFSEIFLCMFDCFIEVRKRPSEWSQQREKIHSWIQQRHARA